MYECVCNVNVCKTQNSHSKVEPLPLPNLAPLILKSPYPDKRQTNNFICKFNRNFAQKNNIVQIFKYILFQHNLIQIQFIIHIKALFCIKTVLIRCLPQVHASN